MIGRRLGLIVCGAVTMAAGMMHAAELAPEPEPAHPVVVRDASQADLLSRVRLANEALYENLQSFVCDETVTRMRESLTGTKFHKLDELTTRVSFENGQEQYTDVRQNGAARSSLSAVGGAWSEGEFGTLLRQTEQLLKTQPVQVEASLDPGGRALTSLSFDAGEEESPWTLVVEGRAYKVPFHTEVTIEAATGNIIRVRRTAGHLPSELCISRLEWAVTLAPTTLNGSSWLLPSSGEYAVEYPNSRKVEHSRLSFGNYRRYGSEAALRFDAGK